MYTSFYHILNLILGDLWPEGDREKGEEPDYIKTEREQFGTFRDLNKDGKMDKVRAHFLHILKYMLLEDERNG